MCINTYIAIIEELVTFSTAASYILGQLDIHSGRHDFLSPHQMSPLHWAADGSHVDMVKALIEKGVDVNYKDNIGVSECECATDC